MSLRTILRDLAAVVSDEAERNPEFAERLQAVLQITAVPASGRGAFAPRRSPSEPRRAANRRPPAVLNPIELAVQGETVLRAKLAPLTLDQLKDIVADYGMDQDKLVMKWRTSQRVIERIIETSVRRAHKGDAFRS